MTTFYLTYMKGTGQLCALDALLLLVGPRASLDNEAKIKMCKYENYMVQQIIFLTKGKGLKGLYWIETL